MFSKFTQRVSQAKPTFNLLAQQQRNFARVKPQPPNFNWGAMLGIGVGTVGIGMLMLKGR